jgi:HTH-type transcriptional regulator / antitoxin HigA
MPATKRAHKTKLPGKFEDLVRLMPPQAIVDDVHCENTTEVIDRLMASGKLTRGQELYLETLVQLVQAYEASRHVVAAPKGIDTLRHLLEEHRMSASGLARLLGVHASMGSKILKGERALTVNHLKLLAAKFKVRVETFMD